MAGGPIVVKVGGSLFDLPDLGSRLPLWLKTLDTREVLLVPGGGPTADAIRELDRRHKLGEEASHWLALRAMSLNAYFLSALLPQSRVLEDGDEGTAVGRDGRIAVLDAYPFARKDEGRPGSLPHSWTVTSDSLAARVARVIGASQLVLLKSVTIPPGISWEEAAIQGWVDRFFAQAVKGMEGPIQLLNLRAWQP